MAAKLNIECTKSKQCKFNNDCILIRPIRVKDPKDGGGSFHPVLKIRMIRNELQLRCFSFTDKGGY